MGRRLKAPKSQPRHLRISRKCTIQAEELNVLKPLYVRVQTSLKGLAKEKGITLVLLKKDVAGAIYLDESADLTEELRKRIATKK